MRMNELRNNAREIVSGVSAFYTLVDEASVRLEESRNGFETEPFPELPDIIEGPRESRYHTTDPEKPLQLKELGECF